MVYIYDLEVLPNLFIAGFLPKLSDEPIFFEISEWKNDSKELDKFLRQKGLKLIGFNNLNYDYPIFHYLLEQGLLTINNDQLIDEHYITNCIYNKSLELLDRQDRNFPPIPEWKMVIPQLDLYKIHHLDNKNKSGSLKDMEFYMRLENVEDMPVDIYKMLHKGKPSHELDRESMIDYNLNDLIATKKFYELSSKKINLRRRLSRKYRINIRNASDSKIGSEIFASRLAPRLGIPTWELKKMRTVRGAVRLEECVFPYINFKSDILKKVLEKMKKITVFEGNTKDAWKDEVIFKGTKYTFGLGGIHGCVKAKSKRVPGGNKLSKDEIATGLFEENETHMIVTSDVTSYYPNLSIRNKFYPRHLTSIYCEVYEDIFNERKMYPKGTDDNKALKETLNCTFGKSNDEFSYFKDLMYMLKTTTNGQMAIMMLCERISHLGKILMANTDGIEVYIPRENREEYIRICSKWEKFTGLDLDHGVYKKMVIRDVNNYIAFKEDGESYAKGVFEIDKPLHKDHSQLIVPKALEAYYKNGTPIPKFIRNHEDPFDFYIRLKVKSDFSAHVKYVSGENINQIDLTKMTRYYVSTVGGYLYRVKTGLIQEDSVVAIKKGMKVTIRNKHIPEPVSKMNINYGYYENECYKVINAVDQGQIKLFE